MDYGAHIERPFLTREVKDCNMKIFKHRTKKCVVIKCENQQEKSALLIYPKNINLQLTNDPLTFFASLAQIPECDFEIFKNEVLT